MKQKGARSSVRPNPPVAIVGMSSLFPDARTLHDFWTNIVQKKDSIIDNDDFEGYWRKADYYDPDPKAKDKTYAYKAGFIPPIDFDPVEFKIPPNMVESISTTQLFALYVAKSALEDANMLDPETCKVDKDKVGVILGGGGNGNTAFMLAARQQAPYLRNVMINSGLSAEVADEVIERQKDLYNEWNEDSFPGFLGNVACGRISSYFDLGGTSSMIDAACASSLAAIKTAIGELADGGCDAVLTGGVNIENSLFAFMCFSKTPALSRTNTSRPFDEKSDGMMLGDGVGLLMLKRLEDAERDGDRIYAVIKSMSASSDGRAKSIFAPRLEGQVKALNRAYDAAGITPSDIELIEAHGTGTVSGDYTEIQSIKSVFENQGIEKDSIALGSIKSQIGHTRTAAGAASMIKAALALHHKVLPPTINVTKPNKQLGLEETPFYINTEARPWIRSEIAGPRMAAISAFGFGGTNYHTVLEEYQTEHAAKYRLRNVPEIFAIDAKTPSELLAKCQNLHAEFTGENAELKRYDYLQSHTGHSIPEKHARLAFVAKDLDKTVNLLQAAIKQLENDSASSWEHPLGIYYKPEAVDVKGRIVALFPGQGSQYVSMASQVANDYPEMRKVMASMDDEMLKVKEKAVSKAVYPVPVFDDEAREIQKDNLTKTYNAQPAIGAVSAGFYNILKGMGFTPDYVAGHSYGELTALWSAGAISDEQFYQLSVARGQAMNLPEESADDRGAMLAVFMDEEQAAGVLDQYEGVIVANYNSNNQLVLGGGTDTIQEINDALTAKGIRCQPLPVSAAFHTSYVAHAVEPFKVKLSSMDFKSPATKVYSNFTGQAYEKAPEKIKDSLISQLVNPVYFKQIIQNIHNDGGYLFVEIGPKGVLSKLVSEILDGKEHAVVSLNPSASADSEEQFRKALAKLITEGVSFDEIDPYQLRARPKETSTSSLTCKLNGGFYVSDESRKRREHAIRVDTSIVDRFIEKETSKKISSSKELNKEIQLMTDSLNTPNAKDNSMQNANEAMRYSVDSSVSAKSNGSNGNGHSGNGHHGSNGNGSNGNGHDVISSQIRAQNVISEVHQQFQNNQSEYIKFLNTVVSNQCSLLEKYHDSEQLPHVVSSLSQSINLLDRNQQHYHANHEMYFRNQNLLMTNGFSDEAYDEANRSLLESRAAAQLTYEAPKQEQRPVAKDPVAAQKTSVSASSIEGNVIQQESIAKPVAQLQPIPETVVEEVTPAPVAEPKAEEEVADPELIRKLEGLTAEILTEQLTTIISDKTGYPSDMIDVDMDLEADLGIDSIKRIEIAAAMFEALEIDDDSEYDADDYQDMESFDAEQFSTIRKMVEFFLSTIDELLPYLKGEKTYDEAKAAMTSANDDASAAEEVSDTAAAAVSAPALAAPAVSAAPQVGFVASTATEAPKQEARSSIGFVASTGASQPAVEAKAEAPLSATVEKKADRPVKNKDAETPVLIVDAPAKKKLNIERYVVEKNTIPLPDQAAVLLSDDHTWLIVDDGNGLSKEVILKLQGLGQKCVRLSLSGKSTKLNKAQFKNINDYALKQVSDEEIAKTISSIEEKDGKIGGLIYLQPQTSNIRTVKGSFRDKDYDVAKSVFLLAKNLQTALTSAAKSGKAFFYVITQIDGELGTAGKKGFPVVSSGFTGLTKALNHEWSGVQCRTVDISPKINHKNAAAITIEELQDPELKIAEVGRNEKNQRSVFSLTLSTDDSASSDAPAITKDSVIMVAGGGRGITADCAIGLAEKYHCKLVLLGRTDINQATPEWAEGVSDSNGLRSKAIEYMRSNNQQPTPIKIEKMVSELLKVNEIKETVERVKKAGGEAIYLPVDVLKLDELKTAVKRAETQVGKITGFVHGAGNLADKRVEKKTEQDFESVFDTKVKGLENILNAVDAKNLQHVFLFSSVSGFFGNSGQTDYSMANEVLNKFAYLFQHFNKKVFVRSINWGPWDSGMVNETLKKAYEERDIAIIPKDTGVKFFVNEAVAASQNPQVIVGSAYYPLSKTVKELKKPITLNRNLAQSDNRFLEDHVIDAHPVLPATCSIAWMVKACEDFLPGYRVENVVGFKVLKGIVFEGSDSASYSIELIPGAYSDKSGKKHALVLTVFSEVNNTRQLHYSAEITMSKLPMAQPMLETANLADSAKVKQAIYQDGDQSDGLLFHGASFRGIQNVLNVSDQRLTVLCNLAEPALEDQGQFAVNSFNPYIADVMIQTPLIWLMLETDLGGLPSAVGKIEQFKEIPFGEDFYVSLDVVSNGRSSCVTTITAHDKEGNIYSRFNDVEYTTSRKLRHVLQNQNGKAKG